MPHIAVDAMSGDSGPSTVVLAIRDLLEDHPDVIFHLVGDTVSLQTELEKAHLHGSDQVVVHHASQVVAMDETPSQALRGKRDSSMHVAISLVREGHADAVVSAGNTGALMALGKVFLRTIPGIDRPAIAAFLPTTTGRFLALDLGANVDCRPEHLLQFAVMGSILAERVMGVTKPRVALLNIGSEEIKGNEQVKEAALLLRAARLNFIGNVEGSDIYKGVADVVVCDGFVGNVALKTSEGLATMISHELRASYTHGWYGRIAYLINRPILQRLRRRLDSRQYNGATLLGLNGIVIKSHGNADRFAFACAVKVAITEAKHRLTLRIAEVIQENLDPAVRNSA
ncbi:MULTISPECIES: phosphate acyltransferase PlsX [Acidithiobacillus]|jgi:glycerol-3-phosphate acyltransferase PlsX|uniref:Phosphate acyltransferase n=3 Tax=Acidithiobacillus ferrooxidans TaxID=920 RepID=B7JC06_ACIF2|nr:MULTISPECIES: phosphate acyltransferase PlsX [Acidithiobacillus]EGQ62813.1 fatty acid/phospholipid synthesis protein PlsX [Acidithiobacillus sp. GGI-221]ACH83802.1 fatty acid/phospholipid synthesis protein PlsX [Acidithiobacillus ferrooxidans ATCC 53993]ACK79952.1 fatty acid/phospholipid synthesis protein PlsX [Acidithiobacillus ferrooxidans ATCC 23270]MBN6745068.1 phosphate acyltransferase PlsX [Acidithiobacillus sp. MC2.2]MBN6747768.1 phosphate acyltransferase PlsX [Acidithiobacillus sp. 